MYNGGTSGYDSLVEMGVNTAMASVRSMTTEQLSALLDSEDQLDALVRSLPTDREAALAQNKSLAEWNLAQKPRIENARTQVLSLYEQAQLLQKQVNELKTKFDANSSDRSLDTTASLLQVAAQEADDDAEAVARKFESGDEPVDLFMKNFKEKKILAHLRKIKSDRLIQLMREQVPSQSNRNSSATVAPYPSYATGPSPAVARHNLF
ncbi:hypothetical protein WR25_19560 [Diploscapter pachys]|uniref:VPS37 C-terminal domain-containing protein n=1 Tax=Diploscapter pachys TaxID=2018661 RepID=A0A2A2JEM6_9BILA|nr:hypothetical protein WR25_19560 [Diploscapter pachys]